MPPRIDQMDAALLLEKRREQNRAAQQRFREKRAAKRPQEFKSKAITTSMQKSRMMNSQPTDLAAEVHMAWSDALLSSALLQTASSPWAPPQPPSLSHHIDTRRQSSRPVYVGASSSSSSSSVSSTRKSFHHSDTDLSSAASSSGHSFSSSSPNQAMTSSPGSEGRPTTTTNRTLSSIEPLTSAGLELPSVEDPSLEGKHAPGITLIHSHNDMESMAEMGLFGGGENWLRPMGPITPPSSSLLTSSNHQGGSDGRDSNDDSILCPSGDGSDPSDPSAISAPNNFLSEGVTMELAWQISTKMTKEQGAMALALLQMGQLSQSALQQLFTPHPDPLQDGTLRVSHLTFCDAMRTNLVTLGWLARDGTDSQTNAVANIWHRRSEKYLRRGRDGRYLYGDADDYMDQHLSLSFPHKDTVMVPTKYVGLAPSRLGRDEERRRIARLRNAPNMHPTKLQLEVCHSIFLDVLPWPDVRDKLIRLTSTGKLDTMEIKYDMMGREYGYCGNGTVLRIHGDDPMDEEAWEMSESFLRKYHGLIGLPPKVIKRTNFWRRLRGEPEVILGQGGGALLGSASASGHSLGHVPVPGRGQSSVVPATSRLPLYAAAAADDDDGGEVQRVAAQSLPFQQEPSMTTTTMTTTTQPSDTQPPSSSPPSKWSPLMRLDLEATLEELLASQMDVEVVRC